MKNKYKLGLKSASAVLIFMFLLTALIQAQTPQFYNFTTQGVANSFPFNQTGGKMVQWIIRAGEYNQPSPATSGNITKFYFFVAPTYPLNATYTGFYIRMGRTALTSLPTGSFYSGSMDTVFYRASGYTINSPASAWFEFILDSPFAYYPDSSLVIEIGQCSSTQGTGFSVIQQSTVTQNRLYSVGGCPFVYSGSQANRTINSGITVVPMAVNCSYSWVAQISGTGSNLFSVKAVNDLVGWAVGAAGVIRKTTNGGTNWVDGDPNNGITADIYNVEALDANTAWCTTSPSATFIYKTTNGGTNWVQVYTLAGAFINAIKMVSATNGYAFGDPTGGNWLMLQTTNGGNNWTTLATVAGTGDGRNNCLQVALPNMWFGTGQGPIWRSTNSGANWSSSPSGITTQILGLHFNSAATGLAGGASAMKSTNGGANWSALVVPGTGNINGIQGVGSDYWYVRGTGVYRSTNDGANWTLVHTAVTPQNDLSFATGSNGCLVGWSVSTSGNIAKMTGVLLGFSSGNNQIPDNYSLEQNYPNPFNPVTSIRFAIPKADFVTLRVYDALGREVEVLVDKQVTAGIHEVKFDASNLSSGIYFYTLESSSFRDSKKMMLIK